MDPVTLIVTALAAGAASAVKDGASAAVKDTYAQLRAAVRRWLSGRRDGELVLARHEADPQTWQGPLAAELSGAGVGDDAEVTGLAQALMEFLDAAGSRAGKYAVGVHGSRGVQVGDQNTQTNTFWPPSA
jgi:hypothetical protein